jgi:tetratricopeptide (TPR) repeat protein
MRLLLILTLFINVINAQEIDNIIDSQDKYMSLMLERAESGNSYAQNSLAEYYHYSKTPIRDLDQAIYWYEKAAENGNTDAALNLSNFYSAGFFGEENKSKMALYWLEKAAKNKDPLAEVNIAWLLVTTEDESIRDGKRALDIIEKYGNKLGFTAGILDTLAAIHAELGNFNKAITLQETAIFLIQKGDNKQRILSHKNRLSLYKQHKTFTGFAHENMEAYKD